MERVYSKVIYVEDEEDIRIHLANALEKVVENLIVCKDAFEVLEIFDEVNPDIVITDIQMPGMTGFELIEKIKNKKSNILTIITSAFNNNDYLIKAIELNATKYILKPLNVFKLIEKLQELDKQVQNKINYEKTFNLLNDYKEIIDKNSLVSKTDKNGIITYVNDEFCKVFEYTKEELIGNRHTILRDNNLDKDFYNNIWLSVLKEKIYKGIVPQVSKYGRKYFLKTVARELKHDSNDVSIEYIALQEDVTELIETKNILYENSIKDGLTNVYNRDYCVQELKKLKSCSALLIDIDKFKYINHYFGHKIGDNVLKYISKKIVKVLSNDFDVFRIGGDEFLLLSPIVYDEQKLISILETINKDIQKDAFIDNDIFIDIDFTCGMFISNNISDHIGILEALGASINIAQNGNLKYHLYNSEDNIFLHYYHNLDWIKKIKRAIDTNNILIYFQPIYDVKSKKITKYESLMRLYDDKDDKVYTPFHFLDIAKETRYYSDLTKILIDRVTSILVDIKQDLVFGLNFSIKDIENKYIVDYLKEKIKTTNTGKKIVIELLESEGIQNYELVKEFIKDMKELGTTIAVDDFGSGYSNFEYLISLDVDALKIDGSIISKIDKSKSAYITAKTITNFAKELNLHTIAEFVSNEEIKNKCEELGIDYLQGYYISEPKPFEEIICMNK